MTRVALSTFLLLTPVVAAASGDTYPRQPGVDALHYVFRLELGDDSDEIVGDATVRVRFRAADVNEVVLDLASVKAGKGMTVSQVLAGGAPVRFTHEDNRLFYSEKALEQTIVVHEVAHQWWGNAVTERDWDDVWLSEGFATYFTLLYTEHVDGRDAFVAGLENSRARILQIEKKMPDAPVIHRNLADMRRVLNQLVYQKGGWVLHMVRGIVGTDVFWNGIREYYRRYRDRNASTDDFRHVIEESSGKDLAWFFSQWLTRSGVPRLEGSWQYDAARRQVAVSLAQSQPGEVYRLPVEIGIVAEPGARPRVERVELRDRSATFSFALDREPASVVLDPGTWLLMEAGPFARKP